ncbi:hypothetical protein DFJ77DRAFT_510129 [Powellomyces hirtus]|nr:hypothetical protein DFJ77DRAFT_510129 [Powellomyces hirtus]
MQVLHGASRTLSGPRTSHSGTPLSVTIECFQPDAASPLPMRAFRTPAVGYSPGSTPPNSSPRLTRSPPFRRPPQPYHFTWEPAKRPRDCINSGPTKRPSPPPPPQPPPSTLPDLGETPTSSPPSERSNWQPVNSATPYNFTWAKGLSQVPVTALAILVKVASYVIIVSYLAVTIYLLVCVYAYTILTTILKRCPPLIKAGFRGACSAAQVAVDTSVAAFKVGRFVANKAVGMWACYAPSWSSIPVFGRAARQATSTTPQAEPDTPTTEGVTTTATPPRQADIERLRRSAEACASVFSTIPPTCHQTGWKAGLPKHYYTSSEDEGGDKPFDSTCTLSEIDDEEDDQLPYPSPSSSPVRGDGGVMDLKLSPKDVADSDSDGGEADDDDSGADEAPVCRRRSPSPPVRGGGGMNVSGRGTQRRPLSYADVVKLSVRDSGFYEVSSLASDTSSVSSSPTASVAPRSVLASHQQQADHVFDSTTTLYSDVEDHSEPSLQMHYDPEFERLYNIGLTKPRLKHGGVHVEAIYERWNGGRNFQNTLRPDCYVPLAGLDKQTGVFWRANAGFDKQLYDVAKGYRDFAMPHDWNPRKPPVRISNCKLMGL